MPKIISDPLRNAILDRAVQNLDGLELKDSGGTTIATATGFSWNAASGGTVDVSGTPTATGNANAGTGTDAVEARLYDDSGSSAEELTGLIVALDQGFSSWADGGTSYSTDDKVTNVIDGTTFAFRATEGHSSAAKNEPGVGETWPDFWELIDLRIDQNNLTDGLDVNINSLTIVQPDSLQ